MVKDKIFKKEFGIELFRIAENDLVAARTLHCDNAVRKETAMLMVQQSIEKALKALLCHAGAPIPQTHDLSLLVDRLSATGMTLPSLITNTDFDELTPFATLRRYEDGHFEIDESDMAGTLGLAESILSWVKGEIA
jgi:HEPN domain-containing protein